MILIGRAKSYRLRERTRRRFPSAAGMRAIIAYKLLNDCSGGGAIAEESLWYDPETRPCPAQGVLAGGALAGMRLLTGALSPSLPRGSPDYLWPWISRQTNDLEFGLP